MFVLFCLFVSVQLKITESSGYVLFSNRTYEPLDICIFDKDQGFYIYWTCYNQQLYLQLYSSQTCNGTSILNQSTGSDYPFNCDNTQNYNHYIKYTIYNLDINGNIECNAINNDVPNCYAQIINKCVYEPEYKVYKMDTCTDTIWNTFRYNDANCTNLLHAYHSIDDCKHNKTYIDITRCTQKLNSIGDQFGYVQRRKTSVLEPLDECIISSQSFSYLFTCIDDEPYYYFWFNNSCDSISNNDGGGIITPFSYSCSSNNAQFARLQIYSNNNNCTKQISSMNYSSNLLITNQCYNLFDNDNNMISSIWKCENSSLWNVQYNQPNCNDQNGSFIASNYTENCLNEDIKQYLVECESVSTTTTQIPETTLSPTKEPTIFITPSPTTKNERIFYVTKTGEDNFNCYSKGICGTLRYTSTVANNAYKWNNLSRIEIVIRGQNPTEIKQSAASLNANPCIPHQLSPFISNFYEITYTFDPNYIHSMEDWYVAELCENHTRESVDSFFWSLTTGLYTIIVNNMIFDGYTFDGNSIKPYYIAFTDTFICNNCIFSNIIIDSSHHANNRRSTLILAANAHFTHCTFTNITYNEYNPLSPSTDIYGYDYSMIIVDNTLNTVPETHSFSFQMISNTEVSNIKGLGYFVYFNLDANVGDFYAMISNTTFTEIAVIDSIINNNPDWLTSTSSTINIINTNFFHLISGSILHSLTGKCVITILNINISTRQTVEEYLENKKLIGRDIDDYYSLFVFDNKHQIINMDYVNVEYLYSHYIATHCSDQFGSTFTTLLSWYQIQSILEIQFNFWLFMYECNNPIQFIDNLAILNINQLSVSNDITDVIIKVYRDYIYQEIEYFLPSALNDDIYIDFFYKMEEDDDYAFIYNDGTLIIDSFNVYGAGIAETIILNPDGLLTINDMIAIPETYCIINNGCKYDADALQSDYWIRFNAASSVCDGGELRISDSFLYGTKIQTLLIGGGYVYLHNITVQYAMSGIIASPKVSYLELLSSDMIDIGTFYSSSKQNLYSYHPVYVPFVLKASEILIKNCIFSYVSPYQFELFDSTGYYENYFLDITSDQQLITLINNVFQINDENVLKPFPSNQTLHYLDDIDLWQRFFDDEQNDTVSDLVSKHFILNGYMVIPNNIKMTMINNKFTINENNIYVNKSVLIDYNMPWIYVKHGNDTKNTEICISGNEFINFAISVQRGNNITSCIKPNMIQYIDNKNCTLYGIFGSIDNIALYHNNREPNIFNIYYDELDTIIKAEENTNIALDNNIININYKINKDINDTVNILNMQSGNYLFVDTVINGTDIFDFDIVVNEECKINCYSVMENDSNLIPILNVECWEILSSSSENTTFSINDLYDIELTTHFSAHSVKISTVNNDSTYFPSDKLLLKYWIFDVYNNQIGNIGEDIMINFESIDNMHSFQIVISSNGECFECENGIYFPSISLNKIGDIQIFKGNVEDNSLFIDDLINITIIECPSGFGATKIRQCDLCNKGYFNLLPTNQSCYYCNENGINVDGITCIGKNNIIIDYNYWIMVYQYGQNAEQNMNLFDMDQYIMSIKCPEKYCCQLQDGCDFINDIDKLCAKNRDYNEYLCGKCIEGYSEVFGTTNCSKCDQNHFERLLIPLLYGFLWTIFILWTKSRKIESENNNDDYLLFMDDKESKTNGCCTHCICCCCNDNDDKSNKNEKINLSKLSYTEYIGSLEKMLSKVLIYFYQSVGYILTSNGIESNLYGFVELFNLNIFTAISWNPTTSNNNNNNNGYCLLKNMTMPQKLAIQLTVSMSILFFILLFYLLNKCASINIYKCIQRKINYSQSLLSALLICVGQILSITFQLLACRDIGKYKTIHYFFGSKECYGTIWIISFISLLFVISSFFILFVFIYFHKKSNMKNDDDDINVKKLYFYSIIRSYKDKYWYWEIILFLKRLLFAFIFIVFDDNKLKIFMAILLTIYSLFIHSYYLPFKWNHVNKFEEYLTSSIIIIIFIDGLTVSNNTEDRSFYNIIISILILFPISYYLWFMISNCNSLKNKNKNKNGSSNIHEIELQPNTFVLHSHQHSGRASYDMNQ